MFLARIPLNVNLATTVPLMAHVNLAADSTLTVLAPPQNATLTTINASDALPVVTAPSPLLSAQAVTNVKSARSPPIVPTTSSAQLPVPASAPLTPTVEAQLLNA